MRTCDPGEQIPFAVCERRYIIESLLRHPPKKSGQTNGTYFRFYVTGSVAEPRLGDAIIPNTIDNLILDLLEWIGPESRPYREVIEAWRTSCPRLPVWEDASDRGFIAQHHPQGSEALVSVSPAGAEFLAEHRITK